MSDPRKGERPSCPRAYTQLARPPLASTHASLRAHPGMHPDMRVAIAWQVPCCAVLHEHHHVAPTCIPVGQGRRLCQACRLQHLQPGMRLRERSPRIVSSNSKVCLCGSAHLPSASRVGNSDAMIPIDQSLTAPDLPPGRRSKLTVLIPERSSTPAGAV